MPLFLPEDFLALDHQGKDVNAVLLGCGVVFQLILSLAGQCVVAIFLMVYSKASSSTCSSEEGVVGFFRKPEQTVAAIHRAKAATAPTVPI